MKKVHHMVSHMVDASVSLEGLDPANYGEGAVEGIWANFLANRNVSASVRALCTLTFLQLSGE